MQTTLLYFDQMELCRIFRSQPKFSCLFTILPLQVKEIYSLYFDSGAMDRISFDEELVEALKASMWVLSSIEQKFGSDVS